MFEQQRFKYYMRPSNALRRYNGCRLVACLGGFLLVIWVLLYQLTGGKLIRVPYVSGEKEVFFQLRQDATGPLALYVYLDNFYSNVRQYRDDAPPYITRRDTCETINTIGQVKSIRHGDSFPELTAAITNDFHPCGLQSATFFNDYFIVFGVDCDNCFDSVTNGDRYHPNPPNCCDYNYNAFVAFDDVTVNTAWYALFATPEDPRSWTTVINNFRLQSWYFKPFMNNRLVFVGMLESYRLQRGIYKIDFNQNGEAPPQAEKSLPAVWPAKEWNSRKEVILATFGPLGSKQHSLSILCFVWGCLLIIISLLSYWAVRRNIVFLSDTMASIPSDEIQNQWILHAKDWKKSS